MSDNNQVSVYQAQSQELTSIYANTQNFEFGQRIAKALASSKLVPAIYQNNIPDTMVALEMANRIGASPLMVMQNLNVIEGRPSWSSTFIISAINSCGRFSALKFRLEKLGKRKIEYDVWEGEKGNRRKTVKTAEVDDMECTAYCNDRATGELLKGPTVSIGMAVAEGWYTKAGSKWKTMPDLMIRYRAAAFFGRLYAPDVLMGMQSEEEVRDVTVTIPSQSANTPISGRGKSIDALNAEIVQPAIVAEGHEETEAASTEQPADDGELL